MLKDKNLEQMFSELTPQKSSDISGGWTFRGNGVWRSTDGSIGTFRTIRGISLPACGTECQVDPNCTGFEWSEFINPALGPSLCELHSDDFGFVASASPNVNIEVWTKL